MAPRPQIVITGVGAAASLGLSAEEVWRGVVEGRSGIGPMPDLEQRPDPDKGGGQAPDLPAEHCPDFPRAARYLRLVVEEATASAGLPTRDRRPPRVPDAAPLPAGRVGAAFGTTLHGMRAGGDFLRSGDPRRLRKFLAGDVLEDALRGLGVGGPVVTTCSACASGLGAVALAATLLRTGEADVMLAGGYDTVSEYAYAGFDSLRLVARGPIRPFTRERDGMKVAEGYGVVVLERLEDALRRGAPVLARLAGFGETSDAFHLTQPDLRGRGAAEAIRIALAAAGLDPGDIGMIAAHGTATPDNDAAEYAALAGVFGPVLPDVPVTAFKSHLGHTLGGAGAVELVLSVLALREGLVPPVAQTDPPDPEFVGLGLVRGPRAAERSVGATLNLSLGFGGSNACAVLTRTPTSEPGAIAREEEVVLTGVGVVLPGVSGSDLTPLRSARLAPGRVPEEQYAHLIEARRTRRMSDYARLTLAAAGAACRDAGLEPGSGALARCSAILGTTQGATNFCEQYYGQIVREGLDGANPVLFAEGVPNAAAAHLSMMLGLRGGCQTIIGSRTAGLSGLALATLRIREGLWERALVGASEEFSTVVNRAYAACATEGGADAISAAAGAVTVVLESRAAAAARGARVLSRIGRLAWNSEPEPGASARVLRRLGNPGRVLSTVGDSGPDLFSVAPLAALALELFEWTADRFALVGTDSGGSAVGVEVFVG